VSRSWLLTKEKSSLENNFRISDKHRKRMKKLLSLVKISTEKNKQDIIRNIELEKEEEYLKGMAKKNLKYKKKLEKFYEKKEKVLRNQQERAREEDEKEKLRITDMTNVEEPATAEDTGISSNRLKSYGL
jgi:predicted restriction endonuclease